MSITAVKGGSTLGSIEDRRDRAIDKGIWGLGGFGRLRGRRVTKFVSIAW